ncbi:MAG: VOC family protein [Planctomycetota bacterium]
MSNPIKISYIEFPGDDLAAIEEFYTKTFGWTFTQYGPEYSSFEDGQLSGGFYKTEAKSSAELGAPLIVLYSEELEASEASVKENGGRICKEIFSFPGGRRFQFLDPHGNELAIWSDK